MEEEGRDGEKRGKGGGKERVVKTEEGGRRMEGEGQSQGRVEGEGGKERKERTKG